MAQLSLHIHVHSFYCSKPTMSQLSPHRRHSFYYSKRLSCPNSIHSITARDHNAQTVSQRASSHCSESCYKFLTDNLLKQGYRYHKLCKPFSKFLCKYYELIEKYHVSLKKMIRYPNFSDLFNNIKELVNRFKNAGYNLICKM